MRTAIEDEEVTRLLREYDRIVARLAELEIDIAKARPADGNPRPARLRELDDAEKAANTLTGHMTDDGFDEELPV